MQSATPISNTGMVDDKRAGWDQTPSFFRAVIQPKLTINPPGDIYEQEADTMAEKVMKMSAASPASNLFFAPAQTVQKKCAHCEEEKQQIQRQHQSSNKLGAAEDLNQNVNGLNGRGTALPPDTAGFFQQRFGYDFSGVKVHTDVAAVKSAQSINALAYTTGNNIVFNQHQFAPSTKTGQRLLAHELTHVVQQNPGGGTSHIQRADFGIFGGKCCNNSPGTEWSLIAGGEWHQLAPEECSPTLEDCDGITCGGGFYHTGGLAGTALMSSNCNTPRQDSPYFSPRRWTPTYAGSEAMSPTQRGSMQGDLPPGYAYDP